MQKSRKLIIFCIALVLGTADCSYINSQTLDMSSRLSGRILIQVESAGEAWYVNPGDQKRYYLGRPSDAFDILRQLGTGITNDDLKKIPVGIADYIDADNDGDGLANRLEIALGTDMNTADTDEDKYSDYEEIISDYDPLSNSKLPIDNIFRTSNAGRIFLQVEKNGEAWYISPHDTKRYYLGRPSDAFSIMRSLGLGISNSDISQILINKIITPKPTPHPPEPNAKNDTPGNTMANAAKAIRENDLTLAKECFDEPLHASLKYNLDFLDGGGRLLWSGMLLETNLNESDSKTATFRGEIYASLLSKKVSIYYNLVKKEDNTWRITNL